MTRSLLLVLPGVLLLSQGCATLAPVQGVTEETGTASYYADSFEGRRTASGEMFRQSELTGAHRTLPFGSLVLVTRVETGRDVTIRINDRLPSASSRVVDLSRSAAELLGMIQAGTARVRLKILRLGS